MKKLTLIRHAKSSWEHPVIDFERPLKKRGLDDAMLITSYLKEIIEPPNLILSSDAKRAAKTAEIFVKNLNFQSVEFQYNNKLYDFSGNQLFEEIKKCNASINNLFIFGHNHAITSFVNTYGSIYYDNIPTCGFVTIAFDIATWKDITPGKTIFKVFPKDLK